MTDQAITPLYHHTSEDTAYPVHQYPYGGLRTDIRFWLEHNTKGYRFWSQTLNPKTQRWNKPKSSTYMMYAGGMYLDEQGHVHWRGISEYTDEKDVLAFLQTFHEAKFPRVGELAKVRVSYLEGMISGRMYVTIAGVKQTPTASDLDRWKEELEVWQQIVQLTNG